LESSYPLLKTFLTLYVVGFSYSNTMLWMRVGGLWQHVFKMLKQSVIHCISALSSDWNCSVCKPSWIMHWTLLMAIPYICKLKILELKTLPQIPYFYRILFTYDPNHRYMYKDKLEFMWWLNVIFFHWNFGQIKRPPLHLQHFEV